MSLFNDVYGCKYIKFTFPVLSFFSGGIIHVMVYDLYNCYYNGIAYKGMTWKRLNNFSAYLGFTLGLSVLYRGKPLLMK